MFAHILSRHWWMTLIQGLIWIAFGIIVFTQPAITLATLILLFGAFAFVGGLTNIFSAIGGRKENDGWWLLLLLGLCGVAVGILTFVTPGITALVLQFYIALWAVATGLLEVVAAIRLRKEIEGELWMALAGVLSIAFGILLVVRPAAGVLALLWLIASYAIVFGVILILLAFKTRSLVKHVAASAA